MNHHMTIFASCPDSSPSRTASDKMAKKHSRTFNHKRSYLPIICILHPTFTFPTCPPLSASPILHAPIPFPGARRPTTPITKAEARSRSWMTCAGLLMLHVPPLCIVAFASRSGGGAPLAIASPLLILGIPLYRVLRIGSRLMHLTSVQSTLSPAGLASPSLHHSLPVPKQ
ncbi:hypothetical protein M011DRAFT_210839 [Sporormia fimetaria CBS 119925]|uniref:Uncharacterized protein n=1 Tax=Sporormia fimetaria CBS 119925 TaxID=1340428 RepID=A0A6A6V2C5_9PLEO|nr:hypothetical protein M011DRAFT_210839 [Sporormia fimetaria CBS 119925]